MLRRSKRLDLRRPLGSRFDPRFKVGDHLRRQRLVGRHRRRSLVAANRLHQQAVAGLTGHNRGTAFASLEQSGGRIDTQLAVRLLPAVTPKTSLRQHPTNLLFKESIGCAIGKRTMCRSRDDGDENNESERTARRDAKFIRPPRQITSVGV